MYKLKYVNYNDLEVELSYENNIAISRTIGLTGNTVNYSENQSFNHVGTAIDRFAANSKEIEINGEILGDTMLLKQQLTRTISPLVRGRLYFNDIFFIEVIPVKTPTIEQFYDNAKFSIVLKAAYPFWRYKEMTTVGLGYVLPRFRFPVNYAEPHRFGEKLVTRIHNVYVNGDITSDLNFTFRSRGYVENPVITNVYTQKFIKLNTTMLTNDIIRVYRDSSRLLRVELTRNNIISDAFNVLDEDSKLLYADPGDNFLELQADEGENLVLVNIEIYDTYLGVWDGIQRIRSGSSTAGIN